MNTLTIIALIMALLLGMVVSIFMYTLIVYSDYEESTRIEKSKDNESGVHR